MKTSRIMQWAAGVCLIAVLSAHGQQKSATERTGQIIAEPEAPVVSSPPASQGQISVPRLIKFSGTLNEPSGAALSGPVQVTFSLYKQEADSEPIWTETQSVLLDAKGNYTVLLGSTQTDGVPLELFSSGEAHWLGVEIQGQAPGPRTLLVSVPYALKAMDAEKLSGRSVSDFVLSEGLSDQVRQVIQQQSQPAQETGAAAAQTIPSMTHSTSNAMASVPPANPPTAFAGSTSNQIVLVQQNGTGGGLVSLTPQNVAVAGHASGGSGSVGVLGQTGGTNAVGVVGIASNPSLTLYQTGVYGQTIQGSGVSGTALATLGFNNGVFGSSASINGTGVFGTNSKWVGVGGQATATSGTPAYGVWGDTASTEGVGVAAFADATTGPSYALYGANSSDSGAAVFGSAFATSGGTIGVAGQVFSPNGTAGVFSNQTGQGSILIGLSNSKPVFSVDASGNLQITGNLVVNGTKSSTAQLSDGRQVALYAIESPENWFEDFGASELRNGAAWVPLDAAFAQATNAAVPYHVYLTPNGDTNGLYVSRKTASGFEVREHGGSSSRIAFDYRIVARRRGYESIRMAEVQPPKVAVSRQLLTQRKPNITAVAPKLPPVPGLIQASKP